tara:strand:+ start:102 stop:395 length:294 start_codon:yes stop_codon:yes gene_type:complete
LKDKITQICGIISFILLTIVGGILCVAVYQEIIQRSVVRDEQYLLATLFILGVLLCSYYLISTRFWETQPNELQNIEYQNELLKKEIEKKELLEKLG